MRNNFFSPITGQGLGVSYSSLTQIGSVFPLQGFGQAGINFFMNLATGNVILFDRAVRLVEENFPIEFQFIYNSLAPTLGSVWQLGLKRFTSLPAVNSPRGQTATLREADGHSTTYTADPNASIFYHAETHGDSTPFIDYNYDENYWIWRDPKTQIVEFYDVNGLLTKRFDARGRSTSYEYENGELKSVTGPSGISYTIHRQENLDDNNVWIYAGEELVHTYVFDKVGRLIKSITPDPDAYATIYSYGGESSPLIINVTQSDGTLLNFDYNYTEGNTLHSLGIGDGIAYNRCYVEYGDGYGWVDDSDATKTTLYFNSKNLTTELHRETGFNMVDPDVKTTQYEYTKDNQLKSILSPNKGLETFDYAPFFGFMTQKVLANGQLIEKYYQGDNERARLICETHYLDADKKVPAVTRYVYDQADGNSFLRFKISAEGRVTEYRPSQDGHRNIQSQRKYLKTLYPNIDTMDPTTAPSLRDMENFLVKYCDPQEVSLTEYTYDIYGQPQNILYYTLVSADGAGIKNASRGYESNIHNRYGSLESQEIKKSATEYQTTTQFFDGLQRLRSKQNALKEKTTYDYVSRAGEDQPYQLKITRPNQGTETQLLDFQGRKAFSIETATGDAQARQTHYDRDGIGRPIVITRPDQQQEYRFYDKEGRLGYTVSTLGIVTAYQYAISNRFEAKIQYDKTIDPSKVLATYPGLLPSPEQLIDVIPEIENPLKDRATYTFFDLSKRKQYEVDSKQSITQYFYDNVDRQIGKIRYASEITDAQLEGLKSSGNISLPSPDFTKDRGTRHFYDKDNLLIAKQDTAGYVTQYLRDAGGRVTLKTLYNTSVSVDFNLDYAAVIAAAKAPNDPKDALTQYAYDARNQLIAELNAEEILITYEYWANGLRKSSTLYANKPTGKFPALPTTSPQDSIMLYDYDLLERQIHTQNSEGMQSVESYDVMGNSILKQKQDLLWPTNLDADFQRNSQAQYDAWNQLVREANPFVGALLAAAKTPDEIKKIWDTQSTRHTFDPSGLQLSTTNSLGEITYFYYDFDRRLIITVDPRGSVSEITLNSFGEETVHRQYKQSIPPAQITGGFMNAALRAELDALKSNKDRVTFKQRDQRGQIEAEVDPNGNTTVRAYNAFKQVDTEALPIASKEPSLGVKYNYDPRGLKIGTIKTAGTEEIRTTAEYKNPLGKKTQFTDGEGNLSKVTHDRLGRVETEINANGIAAHSYERDMLGRITKDTDALGEATTHGYDQVKREEMITLPDGQSTKKLTRNVFEDVIASESAYENKDTWTHAPNGKIAQHVNPLTAEETTLYDLIGQKTQHNDYEDVQTLFAYDNSGNQNEIVEDNLGIKKTNTKTFDPLNDAINEVNPNGISTRNDFDNAGLLLNKIVDPGVAADSLNLTSANQYNGQKKLDYTARGDSTNLNQTDTKMLIDDFGRNTGTITDPDGLALKNSVKLNKANRAIVSIDPLGSARFTFEDGVGNKRFEITPLGGVTEWRYNANNKKELVIQYENKIDISSFNEETPLSAVIALLPKTLGDMDTFTRSVYNKNSQLRFEVDSVGATKEFVYNLEGRRIAEIKHDSPIAGMNLSKLSYSQTLRFLQEKTALTEFDRARYWVLDAAGRERFFIDPDGYVIEQRYDKNNRETLKIRYATQLKDPRKVAALPFDQVLAQILLDEENDSYKYTFYTALGKPNFVVTPSGDVTRFDYDQVGNLKIVTEFLTRATVPVDYEALRAQISQWITDPLIDRVFVKKYDHANRLIDDFDPKGNKDHFTWDALNNQLTHTDRDNFIWKDVYDRASRKVQSIMPESEVTFVTIQNGALSDSVKNISLIKQTAYDDNGNKKEIISAKDTTEQRSSQFFYNKCNSFSGNQIDNIEVDDPELPADLTHFPLKNVTITTEVILNAKQLVVAERNLSVASSSNPNPWAFKVYDQAKRLVFKVNAKGVVTGYKRNRFGEIIEAIVYDTPLTLDLSQYINTGIPLAVLIANLKKSPQDRKTTYDYDRRGNQVGITKDPIYYHACTGPSSHNPEKLTKVPSRKVTKYDAFSKPVLVCALIDPVAESWQKDLYWYDRNRNLQIKASFVSEAVGYYVDWQKNNRDGRVTDKIEYATGCQENLTPDLSAKALKALMDSKPADNDRRYRNEYDVRGDLIKEIELGVKRSSLNWAPNTPPEFASNTLDITKTYQYNNRQLRIKVTRVDGLSIYTFFNAIGKKVAETGIPFENTDPSHGPIIVTPLSYYAYNANGEQAKEVRFLLGAQNVSENQIPLPNDPTNLLNKITLYLKDNRGLTRVKQSPRSATSDPKDPNLDPKSGWKVYTQTATKKIARQIYPFSNTQGQVNFETNLDDVRFIFDILDRKVREQLYRTEKSGSPKIFEQSQNQFNSFDEVTGEGPGDDTFPLVRKFDNIGQVIYTNEPRPTISLSDLRGKQAISIQSGVYDLSKIDVNNLPQDIIDQGQFVYDRTEQQQDNRGYRVAKFTPVMKAATSDDSSNTLSFIFLVSDGYDNLFPKETPCLTWAMPEITLKPKFYLDGGPLPTELPVVHNNTRCGVDLSLIPGGLLNFHINFDFSFEEPGMGSTQGITLFHVVGEVEVLNSHVPVGTYAYQVMNDNQVSFENQNSALHTIALKRGDAVIANIPVKSGLQSLDLSIYESGIYTFSDGAKESLPFAIYTKIPNTSVLSWEIPLNLSIVNYDKYGQVLWNVPKLFSLNDIKMECEYQTADGKSFSESIEIPANFFTYAKPAKEGDAMFSYNVQFEHVVAKIMSVSISLKNFDGTWIPLSTKASPVSQNMNGNLLTSDFTPRDFTYVYPWPAFDETKDSIFYRDTNGGLSSKWIQLKNVVAGTTGFSVDLTGFSSGIYPFQVRTPTYDSPLSMDNSFVIRSKENGGMLYPSKEYFGSSTVSSRLAEFVKDSRKAALNNVNLDDIPGVTFRPGILSELDHWGNEVTRTLTGAEIQSPEGMKLNTLVTKKDYNNHNLVTKKTEPEVLYYETADGSAGESHRAQPVTEIRLNILDQVIGSTNPNKNSSAQVVNAAGNVLVDVLPDGYVASWRGYDGFNRMLHYWDSRNNLWLQQFNNSDRIIQMKKPSGQTTSHLYNEQNILLRQTSPENNIYLYDYSPKVDMIRRTAPTGAVTTMEHNHLHQLTGLHYPLNSSTGYGGSLLWQYDFLGHPLSTDAGWAHQDLGGGKYWYTLNFKMQPTKITADTSSNHGQSAKLGEFQGVDNDGGKIWAVSIGLVPMPNKEVVFLYLGDYPIQVQNNGTGDITNYSYTDFLQPSTTELRDIATNSVLHFSQTQYDELFRPIWVLDGRFTSNMGYDLASNRVKVHASVQQDAWSSSSIAPAELWNLPDACGRMLVDGGILLDNKTIRMGLGQGMECTYKPYNLRSLETFMDDVGTHTVTLDYNNDKELEHTHDNVSGLNMIRINNGDGDLKHYEQTDPTAGPGDVQSIAIDNSYEQERLTLANSTVVTIKDEAKDNTKDNAITTTQTSTFIYREPDLVVAQDSNINQDGNVSTENLLNEFVGFEEWLPFFGEGTVSTDNHSVGNDNNAPVSAIKKADDFATTISKQAHTPDGYLLAVFNGQDKLPYDEKSYSATYFLKLAYDGRVLESVEILTDKPLQLSALKDADDDDPILMHHFFFYGAQGEYLSSYTENISANGAGLKTPVINNRYGVNAKGGCALGFNTNQDGWAFQSGTSNFFLTDYSAPLGAHWTMLQNTPAGNNSLMGGLLSVLPSWDKVGSMETSYPPMTSQRYFAREGDTFESIAEQFYSNANYSADVAMNNDFTSGQGQSQLIAGQMLSLPQFMPLTNNVKNSLPYQHFMAIMEGNLSPYLVIQQEPSFLASILEIIAVVVAIAAAPHLAPAIFATVGMIELSIVAAGVAGLIDFFGQEFLVQLGVEKNISWGDILGASLSAAAGVKGGLMSSVNIGDDAVIQAAMRAGIVNVSYQLTEFAAGDLKAIDLKQILVSMIGAGLGQRIMPELESEFNWGQMGDNAANSVMDGFIDSAIQGKSVNVENMFTHFLQSEAEDALTTGRLAISQAAAQESKTKPATGKIPAPEDTGNAWKTRGREAEKTAAANDDRWRNAGASAIHQKTEATNFMLNQMQQAAAKSGDFITGDDLFKLYVAHESAYQDLNSAVAASENSNNFAWQDSARNSLLSLPPGNLFSNNQIIFSAGRQPESTFLTEVKDPLHYIEGTLKYYERQSERYGLQEKYTNYRNYANAGVSRMEAEISQLSVQTEEDMLHSMRLQNIQLGYAEAMTKYGIYANGLKALSFVGRKVVIPVELFIGGYEVYNATPESRVEVAFEETGAIVGGSVGTLFGAAVGSTETVGTLGLGAPAGIAITVAGNIGGAMIGRIGGRFLYEKTEHVGTEVIHGYDEARDYFKNKF